MMMMNHRFRGGAKVGWLIRVGRGQGVGGVIRVRYPVGEGLAEYVLW